MIAEERFQHLIRLLMNLLIHSDVRYVLSDQAFKNMLRQVPKCVIIVVLTYREIDVVPCDAVNVNVHEGIEELKFVLVNVTILHGFIRQAIRQLKILHCDFCGFLKYY